jgi:hypothetical protein
MSPTLSLARGSHSSLRALTASVSLSTALNGAINASSVFPAQVSYCQHMKHHLVAVALVALLALTGCTSVSPRATATPTRTPTAA